MDVKEYSQPVENVLKELNSSKKGLTNAKAKTSLEKYGFNELAEKKKFSALKLLISQFKGIMVLILIFAAVVSAVLGEYLDAGVIGIIIVLNAVLGFVQ